MEPHYCELADSLIQDGYLKTQEIIDSFERIDRADFVPADQREHAHCNTPLSIGFNQTISQPLSVAFMLELLQPKAGERVLDVGAGSGWQTALLADIVSKKMAEGSDSNSEPLRGSVIAIEYVPELKVIAETNLERYGFIGQGVVMVILGDGTKGYKKGAPYDKIIASASSEGEVPAAWKRQLKIGGRIVAPVGSSVVVIDKVSKMKYVKKEHFGFNFAPLTISH